MGKIQWKISAGEYIIGVVDTNGIATIGFADGSWVGSETLKLSAANMVGESSISVTFTVKEGNAIQSTPDANNLSLYPNPTKNGVFFLACVFTGVTDITIELSDFSGRVVEVKLFPRTTDMLSTSFNINKFAKGVYLVKLITNEQILIRKIVFAE